MNTRFPLFKLFLISSIIISISACANGSDDPISKTDLFASPRTVIANLDTDLTVSTGSRSARTATLTTDSNDVITVDDSAITTAGKLDQNQPVGFHREQDYTYELLSGEVSTTQCILKMTKNEIAAAIGNLDFNKLFTQDVKGIYTIDSNEGMIILLKHFQINHEKGSKVAYIYSRVNVYWGGVIDSAHCYGTYDSVLKCTENSIGTLNTLLYMTNKNSASPQEIQHSYVKFDCSSSQKLRKELQVTNKNDIVRIKWFDFVIDANGIKGHAYEYKPDEHKTEKKSVKISPNKYIAVYTNYMNSQTQGDNNERVLYLEPNGYFTKWKHISAGNQIIANDPFKYSLKFLKNLSGYEIKKVGSGYYLYKNEQSSCLEQGTGRTYGNNNEYTEYYYYDLIDSDSALTSFPCKISESLYPAGIESLYGEYPASPESHITKSTFDSTALETLVNSWVNTL